jgi:hypothetical protein
LPSASKKRSGSTPEIGGCSASAWSDFGRADLWNTRDEIAEPSSFVTATPIANNQNPRPISIRACSNTTQSGSLILSIHFRSFKWCKSCFQIGQALIYCLTNLRPYDIFRPSLAISRNTRRVSEFLIALMSLNRKSSAFVPVYLVRTLSLRGRFDQSRPSGQ